MSDSFDPDAFIVLQTKEIAEALGGSKAMIACSGGVDSTTCAVLTHRAIGDNLQCIFIDTGFMRLGEPREVVETLSKPPLSLPVKLIDAQERFLDAVEGKEDAEEKRRAFRETFYQVLSEQACAERCEFLVQGTIAADVVETRGGIKTQHNVLEQIGINPVERYGFKVVEPLAKLFKEEVRQVARRLKLPFSIVERQPFPGPGLSVRVIGSVTRDKLEVVKKATHVVEDALAGSGAQQYFAAVFPDQKVKGHEAQSLARRAAEALGVPLNSVESAMLRNRATGMRCDRRVYGSLVCLTVRGEDGSILKPEFEQLSRLQYSLTSELPSLTRVLYRTSETERKGKYIIAVRAVMTKDFMTAEPLPIDWSVTADASESIMEIDGRISAVYYDLTAKPPATIEFE